MSRRERAPTGELQPGQTTTLAVAEADLEPPPVDHVFSTSAYAIGRDAQGNYRSFSTNLGGSTGGEFSTPLSDGVSTWLVAEVFGPSLFRYRTMATIPASTVGTAPALLSRSAATVTTRAPLQPALSWTFSGNGDAVQISWWALDPAAPATWTFFAPAGTTAMAYPSLPLAAQPLMPSRQVRVSELRKRRHAALARAHLDARPGRHDELRDRDA